MIRTRLRVREFLNLFRVDHLWSTIRSHIAKCRRKMYASQEINDSKRINNSARRKRDRRFTPTVSTWNFFFSPTLKFQISLVRHIIHERWTVDPTGHLGLAAL